MSVIEYLYEGNQLLGVAYSPSNPRIRHQNADVLVDRLQSYPWARQFPNRRLMLIGHRITGRGPYKSDYLFVYYRDEGWRYDAVLNSITFKPEQRLHHVRSYKLFADGTYEFKYYDAAIQLYLDLIGPTPKGIPLLVGVWPSKPDTIDVYWHTSIDDANRLAAKYGLPQHAKKLPHGPYAIGTTYRRGVLKRIKFYYRVGYTADAFAFEPAKVWVPSNDTYTWMVLGTKQETIQAYRGGF